MLLGDVQQIAGYSVRPLRRSLRLDVGRRVVYSIRSVFREVVYEFLLTFGNTNFGTENMRSPCVTACFFFGKYGDFIRMYELNSRDHDSY